MPDDPTYYLQQDVAVGNGNCGLFYRVEDSTQLIGAFTLSFYAKGTNPGGGNLDLKIDQSFGVGGSAVVNTTEQDITLTGSWEQFIYTFTFASISGKTIGTGPYIQILIKQPADDDSTDAWELNLSNIQLESGTYTSATLPAFQTETYAENLLRCQRYYYKIIDTGYFGVGNIDGSNDAQILCQFPTTMRTAPTALETSGTATDYYIRTTSNNTCTSVPAFSDTGVNLGMIICYKTSHGLTNQIAAFCRAANSDAMLAWDAEI